MENLVNQTLAEHSNSTTEHLALNEIAQNEISLNEISQTPETINKVENEAEKPNKNPIKLILTITKCLGAATVALAMRLFLFEGLTVTGDSQRFFTIAGFGALMTALGLAVYHLLNDRVASRLFLALSMGSIPIVTAVLGGLIFSLSSASENLTIPNYVTWTPPDQASLYLALPIGLLSIAAIAAFGFMVMARSEWRWMTPRHFFTTTMC